ncbi:hypothetical protein HDV01_001203 [Terramyces sp. JEL0728]|nr:hypothetical protein HDV01_001203 [Terramyces sp. JEL0728]
MHIQELPHDILTAVTDYLNYYNVLDLSSTNKYFYNFYSPIRALLDWPVMELNEKKIAHFPDLKERFLAFKSSRFKLGGIEVWLPTAGEFLPMIAPLRAKSVSIIFQEQDGSDFDIYSLLELKNITEIIVDGDCDENQQEFATILFPDIIRNAPQLRSLTIENDYFDCTELADYLPNSLISELHIIMYAHQTKTARLIFTVIHLTKLKALKLSGCGINDDDILTLVMNIRQSSLKELCMGGNEVTDIGAIALADVIPFTKLQSLSLRDINSRTIEDNISFAGGCALVQAQQNSHLEKLDLFKINVTRNEFVAFLTTNLDNYDTLSFQIHEGDDERSVGLSDTKDRQLDLMMTVENLPTLLGIISKSKLQSLSYGCTYRPFLLQGELDKEWEGIIHEKVGKIIAGYINDLPQLEMKAGHREVASFVENITKSSKLKTLSINLGWGLRDNTDSTLTKIAHHLAHTNITALDIEGWRNNESEGFLEFLANAVKTVAKPFALVEIEHSMHNVTELEVKEMCRTVQRVLDGNDIIKVKVEKGYIYPTPVHIPWMLPT